MVISVLSPHCGGNGNTTTALFLALGLGNMKKKVLLTHTDSKSNSLYTYLGLQQYEDKTSTPTQVVKLLREGAIQSESISDYCKNLEGSAFVFTNNKANFSNEDMFTLSGYLVEQSDFDYIVYDFNNENTETAKYVLEHSDVVVLNFTQSVMELEKFKENQVKYAKMLAGKRVMLVCNKYSAVVGTDKEIPKRIGVKATCCVIHYNPWIPMSTNSGKLLDVYKNIRMRNFKVAELNNDITKLATTVSRIKIEKLRAQQQEARKTNAIDKPTDGGDNNAQ